MERQPLRITVATQPASDWARSNDAKTQYKNIDYRNSSDRKWLTNHMMWALTNSHTVTLVPAI